LLPIVGIIIFASLVPVIVEFLKKDKR